MNKWIKRSVGFAALGAVAVAVGAPAQAATSTTGTFNVQTQVVSTCVLTTSDLIFTNYTSGQLGALPGSTTFKVACPGATNLPVTLQYAPTAGGTTFAMVGPSAPNLAYGMCTDSTCGAYLAANAPGAPVSITSSSQNITVYGQINGNQNPVAGAFTQGVTATLNY